MLIFFYTFFYLIYLEQQQALYACHNSRVSCTFARSVVNPYVLQFDLQQSKP
jgi:hypothetical protein